MIPYWETGLEYKSNIIIMFTFNNIIVLLAVIECCDTVRV